MEIHVFANADEVAKKGADFIAAEARSAIAARGVFRMAVSGGTTPWVMLKALALENLPWDRIHVFQIDERVAPAGDPDRNLTHLAPCLASVLPPANLHPMPVEEADLKAAAAKYALMLREPLDLAHLGLGPDGHTASLVPGDPVLDVTDADVALTGVYQKRVRMTVTYPVLNRARRVLWLATGASKKTMIPRLQAADPTIPGGRVSQTHAVLFVDKDAI